MAKLTNEQKLVIVSNRLPVSVTKEKGKLVYTPSSGGLATAMSSLDIDPKNKVWVGWPGITHEETTVRERRQITKKLKQSGCAPVFLSKDQVDNFYLGYANDTIWPLFHYFQVYANYRPDFWQSYKQVNEVYRKAVVKEAKNSSLIWVHDYQLMLLPRMIRSSLSRSSIGFFLHIPFPSYEIFRQLPNRTEIIKGIMGADLIGFHIYDYARHFLGSILRTTGYESKQGLINYGGRVIKIDAFPIGIDYEKFEKGSKKIQNTKIYKSVEKRFEGQKVILSVDRLDYSKGILKRLEAFEKLLKENPKYCKKISLVVIAVPSRTEVITYKGLRNDIELIISRVNGAFSTVDWTPISYQFRNLPFDQLIALYARADVALVTPLRDGMNLVAKEYVASRTNNDGVLILSEMAGAVDELHRAVTVNPNDIDSIVTAMKKALSMPKKEQEGRIKGMKDRLSQYTVQRWASDYINQMKVIKKSQKSSSKKIISAADISEILGSYSSADDRTFFLDYDGTLKSYEKDFKSSRADPSSELINLLSKLSENKQNNLYIISGRPKEHLDKWFSKMKINLVAEHGAWVKDNGTWKHNHVSLEDYREDIIKTMKQVTERTPGATIEEKTSSIVWHYRNVPTELAFTRRVSLRRELNKVIDTHELGIYSGNKVIEVKSRYVHKGKIVSKALSNHRSRFILCIGDDFTDEDMFNELPDFAYSIKVGFEKTSAKFQIGSVDEVTHLLKLISQN